MLRSTHEVDTGSPHPKKQKRAIAKARPLESCVRTLQAKGIAVLGQHWPVSLPDK